MQQYHSWGYTQKTVAQVTEEAPAHNSSNKNSVYGLQIDCQPGGYVNSTRFMFTLSTEEVLDNLEIWEVFLSPGREKY
jgi:hypothetical protein